MLRFPKTTQEKRANGKRCANGIEEYGDYKVRVRAKRSWKQLPDAWDDMFTRTTKCWKKFRKTQYRRIKGESRD
jgi:hypothetical protein